MQGGVSVPGSLIEVRWGKEFPVQHRPERFPKSNQASTHRWLPTVVLQIAVQDYHKAQYGWQIRPRLLRRPVVGSLPSEPLKPPYQTVPLRRRNPATVVCLPTRRECSQVSGRHEQRGAGERIRPRPSPQGEFQSGGEAEDVGFRSKYPAERRRHIPSRCTGCRFPKHPDRAS